jgi:hypothetical protein
MSQAKFLRGFPILAGCGIFLVVSTGMALAQGAPAGAPAAGTPGAAPGAGFQMPSLPKRGFENTGQDPSKYSPEEKAAVAVVEKWIETIHSRDIDGHMALIDDNIVFRGDPLEPLVRGAAYYCSQIVGFGGTPSNTGGSFVVTELYVIGGKWDTQVLLRRVDINGPAGTIGYLGGYPVPVAVHLRIQNGKVVEWYDAPTNKISIGALPFKIQTGGPRNVSERCKKFSKGSN